MSAKKNPRILVTDDEASIRSALREILEFEQYDVSEAASGTLALEKLQAEAFDLLLLDIKMKGMDGFELLEKLNEAGIQLPVIMLTGHGTIEMAVQATRLGAFDFLQKPPDLNRLLITVRNALDKGILVKENRKMRRSVPRLSEIIGESDAIRHIKATIAKVAPTDARVLITGENGTGKELVARSLHEQSRRSDEPFVEVNCAAIPTELLESELFGHEEGAFTGASSRRIGKFEQAHGGTLFLDEIGDMSLTAQAKVLRALQENTIVRVGGTELIKVNVRILAATNKDLRLEIQEQRFREDLYHRLNVIPVHVPPLSDRREDIPLLATAFLREMADKDIVFEGKTFSPGALEKLQRHEWTGNVRELHNVVERLGILSSGPEITAAEVDLLAGAVQRSATDGNQGMRDLLEKYPDFQSFKDATELIFVKYQLDKHQWNISQTADAIGIQRSHLYNKIKKFNLKR
ncbi:MAG: sigma-54 dependent transcriptional regulator [Candidatus Cyclonatronum sp.]|uniref:sigma-54-dependent transcriptional regulator n=1 Tax=Cyclonatronum sp. TaxID=3024185 RepID=UPI0025BBA02C|nr:sigma-54 dependent transcriptional regulator [Cyclonatronum sp.]MCC5934371.1 sigma-54-dependent Fis family transcriptional regulator [Balneolales bacterium]MCH8486086.1 sigma-54 dependent transcriptional regulator [Cyclonatronum sp.]